MIPTVHLWDLFVSSVKLNTFVTNNLLVHASPFYSEHSDVFYLYESSYNTFLFYVDLNVRTMWKNTMNGNGTSQLKLKVVLVGDAAVGKTSLSVRFTEDKFGDNYRYTIGGS